MTPPSSRIGVYRHREVSRLLAARRRLALAKLRCVRLHPADRGEASRGRCGHLLPFAGIPYVVQSQTRCND